MSTTEFAYLDHFEDILEMVGKVMSAVLASFFCSFDSSFVIVMKDSILESGEAPPALQLWPEGSS